jgi:hypothetical protein
MRRKGARLGKAPGPIYPESQHPDASVWIFGPILHKNAGYMSSSSLPARIDDHIVEWICETHHQMKVTCFRPLSKAQPLHVQNVDRRHLQLVNQKVGKDENEFGLLYSLI